MTKEQKLAALTRWQQAMEHAESTIEPVIDLLQLQPESPICDAVWRLQSALTAATADLVGDPAEWLSWHAMENDMGRKGLEVIWLGEERKIKTLDDLLWSIEPHDQDLEKSQDTSLTEAREELQTEPVAWMHDVVASDGKPDQALSFSKDSFPLDGLGGFRSVGIHPLYTQPLMPEQIAYAKRYAWLRSRDVDAISSGGVFAGMTPENVVLNGEDLDAAIDAAIVRAQAAGQEGGAA